MKINYEYKHPILQLNWLPQWMLNTVPFYPRIIELADSDDWFFNACYIKPMPIDIEGIAADKGIIFLVENKHERSCLAHEFRHHWQHFNTFVPKTSALIDESLSAFDGYIKYFITQPAEWDALLFENRVMPNEVNTAAVDMCLFYWDDFKRKF